MEEPQLAPFRGQFFFGQKPRQQPANFKTIVFADDRVVCHHPDLPIAIVQDTRASGILIGFVFDPDHPEHTETQILRRLLDNDSNPTKFIAETSRLAGRWAAIFRHGDQSIVLHDACGTMPVCYTRRNGGISCASSSMLLNFCLGDLAEDLCFGGKDFQNYRFNFHSGLPYPVQLTEFSDGQMLLPNHSLDLNSGDVKRFYPRERRPDMPVSEAAPKIADMLKNIILSASFRFPLALGITAGFDSRALVGAISANKGIDVNLFTFQDQFACPPDHFDISTGRKIAQSIGFEHQEIVASDASDCVRELCRASETMIAPSVRHQRL